MEYISTRDQNTRYSLREAAYMGLAPDGGLFMPERIPQADMSRVIRLSGESYNRLVEYLAGLFFGDELSEEQIRRVVSEAYDFKPVLHRFGNDNLFTLELFHGPTFAFKDFGARFMGRMFGALNRNAEKELIILTATSGDTGSAVAGGFYKVPGVKVVLLYPSGRISDLQESQMTTLGENIYPLRVEGSFDDCQALVKTVFSDREFCRERRITSANSINILRWIPQAFYYFYGYCAWCRTTGRDRPDIVVPSGNYGNLSAGMLAKAMSLPVGKLIAASNENDVVPRFLAGEEYRTQTSVRTVANAMDVGNPSNYERIMALYGNDAEKLRREVKGFSASDEAIKRAIGEVYEKYGYWIDPHSATGYLGSRANVVDGFWLSTAHEAKFREVLAEVLPQKDMPQGLPDALAKGMEKERIYTPLEADAERLKDYLLKMK